MNGKRWQPGGWLTADLQNTQIKLRNSSLRSSSQQLAGAGPESQSGICAPTAWLTSIFVWHLDQMYVIVSFLMASWFKKTKKKFFHFAYFTLYVFLQSLNYKSHFHLSFLPKQYNLCLEGNQKQVLTTLVSGYHQQGFLSQNQRSFWRSMAEPPILVRVTVQ